MLKYFLIMMPPSDYKSCEYDAMQEDTSIFNIFCCNNISPHTWVVWTNYVTLASLTRGLTDIRAVILMPEQFFLITLPP